MPREQIVDVLKQHEQKMNYLFGVTKIKKSILQENRTGKVLS